MSDRRKITAADHPPLPALALVKSSAFTRFFARALVFAFFLLLLALAILPWRQFVDGHGAVIAFNPLDRRINVESPVSGRVRALHVVEGRRVRKGEVIAEIQDNDPLLLENLRAQQLAMRTRLEMARERVEAVAAQSAQQQLAKARTVDGADQRMRAARVAAETAALQHKRVAALAAKGLSSARELELATLSRDSSAADLKAAEAALQGTGNSFDATLADIAARKTSALADVAAAERDLASMQTQINRTLSQVIEAPRDGVVLEVAVTDGTYLKPGSPVCVIIPETDSRFVELWVDGNDAPLIQPRVTDATGATLTPGSPVRLAFSGWPAVQAIGWPNLAVGTFGGEVVFMDPTDDGKGKFRIVVAEKPDVYEKDGVTLVQGWPERDRWLRQGVRAEGWVMLEKVPLWYEVWRRANGFPPVVRDLAPSKARKKTD